MLNARGTCEPACRSVAQAWVRMYYLDRICQLQMEVLKSGRPFTHPSEETLSHARDQVESPAFAHGRHEWDSLCRLAKRSKRS